MEPRELALRTEDRSQPLRDDREHFAGYGVMGLPFASGHVLGLRRFPASSVGPGYSSVWHRDPEGRWTFYSDQEALLSCNRYFGSEIEAFQRTPIEIDWTGPREFTVRVPGADLTWDMRVAPTAVTRAMNLMGSLMPEPLWLSGPVLDAMARMAGPLLGLGRVNLRGEVPNGQRFIANPRLMWLIPESTARVGGEDLGPLGPLPRQAALRDFTIPQRGVFVVGMAFFDPFDPERHLAAATRAWG